MNIYAIPPLISSVLFIMLGFFVLFNNPKSEANQAFGLTCFTTFWWQFSWFFLFNFGSENLAKILVHVGYTGIIFIPITFYHFFIVFLKRSNERFFVKVAYIFGVFLLIFNWTSTLFVKGYYKYFWGYYPKAGILHPAYLTLLFLMASRAFYLLRNELYNSKISPFKYNQVKYLFCALVFYTFASLDFAANYGVDIYPPGFIFIMISLGIVAYAIVRYRLMDIKVAVTRTGIFIAVYTLVLGLPFALANWLKPWLIDYLGPNWWIAPLILMAVLATVGPFIYIYLERKAEARLLKEQKRYQDTLKQASAGMTRIRNLRRLLDLITHIVTKTVRIGYAAVYLHDRDTDEFILQVSRDKGRIPIPKLTPDNPLIAWLITNREPLIYEEVKRQMSDSNNNTYKNLEESMRLLDASVVIPSFLEDKFMGFFVLGDKITGQIYTPDDLNVFRILASQAALAIENAQFYEEAKEMQEQIAQAEKMATIGTMADGLSHQINNRFYALSLIAGDTLDTIKMTDTSACTPEVKEMVSQINHALERIQTNVIQGGDVVKGILKYTRRGDAAFEGLTIDQILDGTLEMVQFKVKLSEIDIVRDYSKETPKVKANLTQLQEVFFNFIDNAYDAIVERRDLLREEGYRGRITVSANPKENNTLEIIIEDNGMGVKEEDMKKMFTPFFTTKVSSRRGTGLGLYVINRILTDNHKGKISVESEYKIGTRFIVELPVAQ